jgi:hypothetical protein
MLETDDIALHCDERYGSDPGSDMPGNCANFAPKSRLHLENRAMVLPAP